MAFQKNEEAPVQSTEQRQLLNGINTDASLDSKIAQQEETVNRPSNQLSDAPGFRPRPVHRPQVCRGQTESTKIKPRGRRYGACWRKPRYTTPVLGVCY